jgi:hypothetical protein
VVTEVKLSLADATHRTSGRRIFPTVAVAVAVAPTTITSSTLNPVPILFLAILFFPGSFEIVDFVSVRSDFEGGLSI